MAAALRLFVAVELAFDAVGGAVEQVDGGPEQVFEVGLEAGFCQRRDQGVEDVGQRGTDLARVGERAAVRLVLEGPVPEELEFAEEGGGRGGGVVGLVLGEKRWVIVLCSGSAAPIAAFAGVEDRERTGLAPQSGRSAAEDGGARLF